MEWRTLVSEGAKGLPDRAGEAVAMWRCEQCGAEAEDHFEVCWSCGIPRAGIPAPEDQEPEGPLEAEEAPPPVPTPPDAPPRRCPHCATDLEYRGGLPLRIGGRAESSPPLRDVLGLLRDVGDQGVRLWTVLVWSCPDCRRLELYEDE